MLLFLLISVLLVISATELLVLSATETNTNKNEETLTPLSFFVLSDWGKGGSTGNYGSNINSNNEDDEDYSIQRNNNNNNIQSKSNISFQGGGGRTFYQLPIAAAMSKYCENLNIKPSFVLSLGDNFYNEGVSSSTDILWTYLWTSVYLIYNDLKIPWYPIFGNHDYGGGASYVEAQLDRTREKVDQYWKFYGRNYSQIFTIPSGGMVEVIFIDTVTLAPSENKVANVNGGISTDLQAERIADQLYHIEKMIIVCGHYPVYSQGGHGDTAELIVYLVPLLEKYNVDAYISGHDHINEHLFYNNINYYIMGAGAMTDSLGDSTVATVKWNGIGYAAFGLINATSKNFTVNYIDTNNKIQYTHVIQKSYVPTPTKQPSGGGIIVPIFVPSLDDDNNDYSITDDDDEQIKSFIQKLIPNEEFRRIVMSVTPFLAVVIILSALSRKRKMRGRRKSYLFEKNDTNSKGKYKLSDPSHSNVTSGKNFRYKTRFINKGRGNNSILPFAQLSTISSEDEGNTFISEYKSSSLKNFMGGKFDKVDKKSNQFMQLISDSSDTDHDYDNIENGYANKRKNISPRNVFTNISKDLPKYSYKGTTPLGGTENIITKSQKKIKGMPSFLARLKIPPKPFNRSNNFLFKPRFDSNNSTNNSTNISTNEDSFEYKYHKRNDTT